MNESCLKIVSCNTQWTPDLIEQLKSAGGFRRISTTSIDRIRFDLAALDREDIVLVLADDLTDGLPAARELLARHPFPCKEMLVAPIRGVWGILFAWQRANHRSLAAERNRVLNSIHRIFEAISQTAGGNALDYDDFPRFDGD